MGFKLAFSIPFEISPLIEQDTIHFFIKDEGYPLFTSKNRRILDPSYRFLKKKVPKQIPDTAFTENFVGSVESANN